MLLASQSRPTSDIPPPAGVPAPTPDRVWFEDWDLGVVGVHVPDDTRPGEARCFCKGRLGWCEPGAAARC